MPGAIPQAALVRYEYPNAGICRLPFPLVPFPFSGDLHHSSRMVRISPSKNLVTCMGEQLSGLTPNTKDHSPLVTSTKRHLLSSIIRDSDVYIVYQHQSLLPSETLEQQLSRNLTGTASCSNSIQQDVLGQLELE